LSKVGVTGRRPAGGNGHLWENRGTDPKMGPDLAVMVSGFASWLVGPWGWASAPIPGQPNPALSGAEELFLPVCV
jgi:hypothetical protein